MNDTQTTVVLVGAVVALARAIEWLAKATIAKSKDKNGNAKLAGLTVGEWKQELRLAVKDTLRDTAAERHQDLRKLMKDVLEQEFLERDKTLRDLMRDELGRH
jgi:hypothetical protein